MQTSESIAALAKALAVAQGQIKPALKDSANPHFKSKYADLSSVWEACRVPLTANGLSVVQAPGECADGQISVTTMLLHESGEWMRETLTIPLAKVDAQGYGSATTYARRYALAAMAGVAPDDDDGNGAVAAAAGSGAANDRRSSIHPQAGEQRKLPEKLQGKHKTRAALRDATKALKDRIAECVEAKDRDSLEIALSDERETLQQLREEVSDWWTNPDYGMDGVIQRAYEQLEPANDDSWRSNPLMAG